MKLTRKDNILTIELDPGESFSKIEHRERSYGGNSIQIWIQIKKL